VKIILEKRIKPLNNKSDKNGEYILYWMQSTHRTEENWALTYTIQLANKAKLPVVVYFGLTSEFPEANYRHYWFMLEGLQEVDSKLRSMDIKFVIKIGNPIQHLVELSKKASLVIVDRGYLKVNKVWYKIAAENIDAPLIQVEDNVIVPVEEASQKEEYAAATLRPKLLAKLNYFLDLPAHVAPIKSSMGLEIDSIDIKDLQKTVSHITIDKAVNRSIYYTGGTSQAKNALDSFFQKGIEDYEETGGRIEMDPCHPIPGTILHGWKKGDAECKKTCNICRDVVPPVISPVKEKEESYRAYGTHEKIPHAGVIIDADIAKETISAEYDRVAENQHKGKQNTDPPD
jgi:deoxyribodipyrimidine photo-lyase